MPDPTFERALAAHRAGRLGEAVSLYRETIARDPSTTQCDEGWQYTADGRNIMLCGDACAAVRADPDSTIEVLFGCQTVTSKPR